MRRSKSYFRNCCRYYIIALTILVSSAKFGCQGYRPKVAIIGAGIGGATAAFHISNTTNAYITVFEASGRVGGRLKEVEIDGQVYELGGSIGIAANRYFVEITGMLNLTRIPQRALGGVGFWNGTAFTFAVDGSLTSKLQALLRYQLAPFISDRLVAEAVRNFTAIYALQDGGTAFASARALWAGLGMAHLADLALADFLASHSRRLGRTWIGPEYVDEVVAAQTHANYNQAPADISALAGLIALAPDGSTFTVANGTAALPEGLLRKSRARVRVGARVRAIRPAGATPCAPGPCPQGRSPRWALSVEVAGGAGSPAAVDAFDAVLIAAPLGASNIAITGPAGHPLHVPPQPYQPFVTTYCRGVLSAAYFGRKPGAREFIAVTAHATAPFRAIAPVSGGSGGGLPLVKIFSPARLPRALLTEMFEGGAEVVAEQVWEAYPHYAPPEALASFRLAPGLFYLNSIEAGASCIEIAAISGRNAALLTAAHLTGLRAAERGSRSASVCGADGVTQASEPWLPRLSG